MIWSEKVLSLFADHGFSGRTIFSEKQFPLFGIML